MELRLRHRQSAAEERKRIDPDHFDTEALHRTVHKFYREKKYPAFGHVARSSKGERYFFW